VSVVFAIVPSEPVADSILHGNLSNMAARDPGFYGKGIYFSFDPEYCVRWYGRQSGTCSVGGQGGGERFLLTDGSLQSRACLMVFAVSYGNSYLVTERVTTQCREGLHKWQQDQDRIREAPKHGTEESAQNRRTSLIEIAEKVFLGTSKLTEFFSSESLLGNPLKPKSDSHLVAITGSWRHGSKGTI
jgi:hypothetical protein